MGKHVLNKLTAANVNNATKKGCYSDGGGLYLSVSSFGTKSWVFRYTQAGKTREMGLGACTVVSLKEARLQADKARKLLRDAVDPIDQRKSERSVMVAASRAALTFRECASAFITAKAPEWKNAKHGKQWESTLETHAYPTIGNILVRDVEQAHILKILEPIWTTKTETASRLRGRIESVLDYATVRGYRKGENPARWKGHLDKILAAPSKVQKVEHHAALDYREIGTFMVDLRKQVGMGARALEFAILTACRSGEARGATWAEIDGDTWVIPASRMKAGREHRIPLSDAAVQLLQSLPRVDDSDLLFPSSKNSPLSDMTLTAVLRRMKVDATAHGFRSTFRDWAGETTAYPREVIEHALAHQLADKAEAAYARGTLFDKRRSLMAAWAKHCSTSMNIAAVMPINGLRGVAG